MGKCDAVIQEIRIDTRDEKLTQIYILVNAVGDCPMGVQGWHHKTFSADVTIVDILQNHIEDHLLWGLNAPPD